VRSLKKCLGFGCVEKTGRETHFVYRQLAEAGVQDSLYSPTRCWLVVNVDTNAVIRST
jgi:hypothetical protein